MTTIERRHEQIAAQVRHTELNAIYIPLYDLAEELSRRVFYDADWTMPPLITLEEERGKRGSYRPLTTWGEEHVININPWMHANGYEAAQTLCHEMLHMWQQLVGRPCNDNMHTDEFHERMWTLFGIRTDGKDGDTTNVDMERFCDMMLEMGVNPADLSLVILPGSKVKKARRMYRHTCPKCEASFHARTEMNVLCGKCTTAEEEVQFRITR